MPVSAHCKQRNQVPCQLTADSAAAVAAAPQMTVPLVSANLRCIAPTAPSAASKPDYRTCKPQVAIAPALASMLASTASLGNHPQPVGRTRVILAHLQALALIAPEVLAQPEAVAACLPPPPPRLQREGGSEELLLKRAPNRQLADSDLRPVGRRLR